MRHVLFVLIAIFFLAFARGPLIDGVFDAIPDRWSPMLVHSDGPTPLGYGAMGLFAILLTLAVVMPPYWLISKMLNLPIRDDPGQ